MVMALAFDHSGSFTRVATKRKTKVSVGFEWEIPAEIAEECCNCCSGYCDCDECDCYCSCGEEEEAETNTETNNFIDSHGFRTHCECGGLEFASPVFGNIGTARRVASALKEVALQDRALGEDANPDHCCGIHVHASHVNLHDYPSTKETYWRVVSMLNRKSSANFVMEFSGRKDGNPSYLHQAKSIGWDTAGVVKPSDVNQCDMGTHQMVRQNGFGSSNTIEYRLWHTSADRLLPAIDFAHACTTFIMTRKDIPYLKDFKAWLDKQTGYKILKQDNAWRLL